LLHLNVYGALEVMDICHLWHQHHGSWCMKSIATRVHISPQRIGHWSSEKCLLHGNVLFLCNRLSISVKMYSYFGERFTLQSIVWHVFVTTDTARFVTLSFFCGFHHQKCHSPVLACPTCAWNLSVTRFAKGE
jgi:hypothetical protein